MRTGLFRVLFSFLSVVLIASPLFGVENPEWNNLKQLSPGQRVRVQISRGKFAKGEFQSVNDDGIAIRVKGADQRFQRSSVQQVSSRRSGHRMRHALIGAAIGAGVGLGTGAAIDNDCNPQSIVCTATRENPYLPRPLVSSVQG